MRKQLLVCAAMLAFAFAVVPPLRADPVTYDLCCGNTQLSAETGPYATATVTLTSPTTATVTFTSLTSGGYTYYMGGAQAVDLNVNATSFTVLQSDLPSSIKNVSINPTNDVDSFGNFNLQLDNNDGSGQAFTLISFTLTNTSGTWSSAADVLAPNSSGYPVAAHIYPYNTSTGTFPHGLGGFASIPEPASLTLLGAGLLLAGLFARRFHKS